MQQIQTARSQGKTIKHHIRLRIDELKEDVLVCEHYLEMPGITANKAAAYRKLRQILKQSIWALEGKL